MNMPPKKRSLGAFSKRKVVEDILLEDIWSPWNFYRVLDRESEEVHEWLRSVGLLACNVCCEKCGSSMRLNKRQRDPEGVKWRCQSNRGHEKSVRAYSFFERGHTSIQVSTEKVSLNF